MKKFMLFLMLLLTVCSSAFAESIDGVLKDCKLDKTRWIVVEWSKADNFVRFYDSTSVTVTGPSQFDVVISDYYYGNTCNSDSCKQRGNKHYHSEKWRFNTTQSTGTLRSMTTKDLDENVVSSYDIPAKMQVESELNKKSIEAKTMQKIKALLKDDKKFTAEPKLSTEAKNTVNQPKIKGLAPLPMPIGAVDGEWTYMGRYISGGSSSSILEWETRLHPYTSSVETSGLYDVYFHHEHYEQVGNYEGRGCYVVDMGGKFTSNYGCVLKIVPLTYNGVPFNQSGEKYGTVLLSTRGSSKGAYGVAIQRLRIFDNVTHQLLVNIADHKQLNGNFQDYMFYKIRENSPYMKAMEMSNCPIQPYDGRHG